MTAASRDLLRRAVTFNGSVAGQILLRLSRSVSPGAMRPLSMGGVDNLGWPGQPRPSTNGGKAMAKRPDSIEDFQRKRREKGPQRGEEPEYTRGQQDDR